MSEVRGDAHIGQPESATNSHNVSAEELLRRIDEREERRHSEEIEERRMMRATLLAFMEFCKANGGRSKNKPADPISEAVQLLTLDIIGGRTPNLTEIGRRVGMTPHGLRKNRVFKDEVWRLQEQTGGQVLKGFKKRDGDDPNATSTVDGIVGG